MITEHNFGLFWPKPVWDQFPEQLQTMFPPETITSQVLSGSHVVDPKVNFYQIQLFLQKDVRFVVDMHTNPTFPIKKFVDHEEFVNTYTKVWQDSGELDPSGASLPYNKS